MCLMTNWLLQCNLAAFLYQQWIRPRSSFSAANPSRSPCANKKHHLQIAEQRWCTHTRSARQEKKRRRVVIVGDGRRRYPSACAARVLSVSAFLYCGAETHITKATLLLRGAVAKWKGRPGHWGCGVDCESGPLLITARNHIFEVLLLRSRSDKFKAEIEKHAGRERAGVGLGEKRRKRSQRALVLCSISKIGRLSTKTKATSTSKQIPS